MNENETNKTPPATSGSTPSRMNWPMAVVGLGLLGLIAFIVVLRTGHQTYLDTVDRGGQAVKSVAREVGAIAEKFTQGTITTTFLAALPNVSSTGMGNLELAVATQTETLRTEDEMTVFWDKFSLGKTVTEIRVPVTYRYHLKLADKWSLDVKGPVCIVRAPKIRPSLPPAVHTDRMEKNAAGGWARFNAGEQMSELERSLTPTFAVWAMDQGHLPAVREECRKTVAEFVRNWLLKEDQWRTDRFHTIKVIFADEPESTVEMVKPTIELLK